MKRFLLTGLFVLMAATSGFAVPMQTAEYGTVPQREYSPLQDVCHLQYYNLCSGWVWYWTGYCNGEFEDNLPVKYGTSFNLADCPMDCAYFDGLWWAVKTYSTYGLVDVELYCTDNLGCPHRLLGGIYGYVPDASTPWQFLDIRSEELDCITCGHDLLVLVTDWTAGIHTSPYSDHVPRNVEAGCHDWRCWPFHSYVYKNVVDYCDMYGAPAPTWVNGPDYGCTFVPPIPPGCHDYPYPTGVHTEFLIDCDLECLGATPVEDNSWSEIKALFR